MGGMKMRELMVAGTLMCAGSVMAQNLAMINNPQISIPSVQREMRAAWVASVYGIDWPTTRGTTTTSIASQRTQMNAILDGMAAANMNCVFLQVRSAGDAMYPSTLEPWSYYLTGRQGLAPTGTYDPLAEWIVAARQRGMQLYAWVNPYRMIVNVPSFSPPPGTGWVDTATTSSTAYVHPLHSYRSRPSVVKLYENSSGADQYWLDPGEPASAAHSKAVIMDIVNRYDIDGLVFDDYFYPYPNGLYAFPDTSSFALYGGGLTLSNWRRKNVNDFVYDIYTSIKAAKPQCLFGIGPFGIWQPGNPAGVTGLNSYAELYADSKLWLNNGWVDFLAPQLYWKISSTGQPYGSLLNWWVSQNTQGRHVWASNYTSQLIGNTWPAQEIIDQISVTRNTPGATGNVHYSAKVIRDDTQSLKTLLANGLYSTDALIPASAWLDNAAPARPILSYSKSSSQHLFTWSLPGGSDAARWYLISTLVGTTWSHSVVPSSTLSTVVNIKSASGSLRAIGVAAVDKSGNQSAYATRVFDPSVLTTRVR